MIKKVLKNKNLYIFIFSFAYYIILIRFLANNDLLRGEFLKKSLLLIVIFIIMNIFFVRDIYRNVSEKKKLEINVEYQNIMDELIHKYRATEHEYKNHLNTLAAMVNLDGYEALSNDINKYVKEIAVSNAYSNLKYIDNVIIKAVLYNKIKECQEKNIKFNYSVKSNMTDCSIQDTELSTVINNLINNAIEAVALLENRRINIEIYYDVRYIIQVSNTYDTTKSIDLSEIFKKGKSSKGNNRGYGLYTVKRVVEKNNGSIDVDTKDKCFILTITV